MESSTRTGELEPASVEPADFEATRSAPATAKAGNGAPTSAAATEMQATTEMDATAEMPATTEMDATAEMPATTEMDATMEVHPSMVAAVRDGCPVCGAAMAADQHYCLECGERRGPPRVPLKGAPAAFAAGQPPARGPRRRASMSVNATLIAGVSCLLLALGIGVLIGRSGNGSSSKSPPVRVVTVAGAGGAAAAPTGETAATAAAASGGAAEASKSSSHASKSSTKVVVKKPTVPLPKPVKVGSPGHGKGYEHGHFTGNFFGGEGEKE